MLNKNCPKCFGTGEMHNGYYSYPCDCMNEWSFDLNRDSIRLTSTEIQYLRGLIIADRIENDYENVGMKAKIDHKTSMNEFTDEILKKLDELEEGLE